MTTLPSMLEAFDSEQEMETPVGESLLAAAPPAAEVDEAKLEDAAARHRVLLIRTGAVIALTSLVAIGGAILLHLLAAGVIVVGLLIPWHGPSTEGSGHSSGAPSPGSGGALILGSPLADAAAPRSAHPTSVAPLAAAVSLPPLPSLVPDLAPSQPLITRIPIPDPADLGTIHITPPTPPTPAIPANAVAVVAPSSGVSVSASSSTGVSGNQGSPDGEPLYSLNAGDGTKTVGAGGRIIGDPGHGEGDGHDYGLSAADRPPQILGNPDWPSVPAKYAARLTGKEIGVIITVRADGVVTNVKVVKSCGIPDVDELFRQSTLASVQVSPAFHLGKAVTADKEYSFKYPG